MKWLRLILGLPPAPRRPSQVSLQLVMRQLPPMMSVQLINNKNGLAEKLILGGTITW
jgi:hypothetical protein